MLKWRQSGLWAALAIGLAGVSGCAWFDDNKKQPNELSEITQRVEIHRRWKANVGSGLSELYRLMPPVIKGSRRCRRGGACERRHYWHCKCRRSGRSSPHARSTPATPPMSRRSASARRRSC